MSDEEKVIGEAVQLILNRMDSNPEEFVVEEEGFTHKWGNLLSHYSDCMTAAEKAAVKEKIAGIQREARRTRLHHDVMKKLLGDQEEETKTNQWHHIAVSKNSSTTAVYVNGKQAISTPSTDTYTMEAWVKP